MLEQLPPDQLPDVPGADDHGVLDVPGMASHERPRGRPRADYAEQRQQPERRQLPLVRSRETDEPGRRVKRQHADRDQVEDIQHLVSGGMRRTFLVAVVEAVQLRGDEPGRQSQHEDHRLESGANPAFDAPSSEENFGRCERCQKPGDVGGQQRSPDKPAASSLAGA